MAGMRSSLSKLALVLIITRGAYFPVNAQGGGQLGVHPGYSVVNLRPPGFEPQVTGLDFLPDGRLVISTIVLTLPTAMVRPGALYIVSGTEFDDASQVTYKKVADSLADPLGLKVIDGKIYVTEHNQITLFEDKNNDGTAETRTKILSGWNFTGPDHEFAFGPLYKDGFFYAAISVSIIHGGPSRPIQPAFRGCVLRGTLGGQIENVAGGLRNPNGINFGPDSEMFVTDNQGDWLPSSKLLHVKTGRFFGHASTPFADQPVSPPVVWLPHGEAGRSPTQPMLVKTGTYAGQFLIPDIAHGGITRVFMEKIKGEYQGCAFPFTGGLEAGMDAAAWGPDGSLFLGGLGDGDISNWGWLGKLFGLQKLKPNGKSVFEMKAVRSIAEGLEIEFTEPANADAGLAAKYKLRQWRYDPTSTYGGPKVDERDVVPTSVSLSPDRKKVVLAVTGLQAGYVVHIMTPDVKSANGTLAWTKEAWYTFNRQGPADIVVTSTNSAPPKTSPSPRQARFPRPGDFFTPGYDAVGRTIRKSHAVFH